MNKYYDKDWDKFWDGYKKDLNNGYFRKIGSERSLKPKFIVEYPEKIAQKLKDRSRNKLSQIWKFYNHARQVQDNLQRRGVPLDVMRADLCELLPAVNYAKVRGTVTDEFKDFIDFNVRCINDIEDLGAFIKHFQSIIAYLPKN